jgi:hypothetical protein
MTYVNLQANSRNLLLTTNVYWNLHSSIPPFRSCATFYLHAPHGSNTTPSCWNPLGPQWCTRIHGGCTRATPRSVAFVIPLWCTRIYGVYAGDASTGSPLSVHYDAQEFTVATQVPLSLSPLSGNRDAQGFTVAARGATRGVPEHYDGWIDKWPRPTCTAAKRPGMAKQLSMQAMQDTKT